MLNPIDDNVVREAVNLVLSAAPGAEVIVFGSRSRGDARAHSDLDLLVVVPDLVSSEFDEVNRLRDVLRPMHILVDVIVVTRKNFQEWQATPGTVIYEAAREGKRFQAVA